MGLINIIKKLKKDIETSYRDSEKSYFIESKHSINSEHQNKKVLIAAYPELRDKLTDLTSQFDVDIYISKDYKTALESALDERPEIIVATNCYNELIREVNETYNPKTIGIDDAYDDRFDLNIDAIVSLSYIYRYENIDGKMHYDTYDKYKSTLANLLDNRTINFQPEVTEIMKEYYLLSLYSSHFKSELEYSNDGRYMRTSSDISILDGKFENMILPKENKDLQRIIKNMAPGFIEHNQFQAFQNSIEVEEFIIGVNTKNISKVYLNAKTYDDTFPWTY